MFCPKCGTENQEDLVYCRSCGEDLQIISQAMKKHLPLALVSKLDAVLEQKHERIRRDAILFALAGTVFLISSFLVPLGGDFFFPVNIFIFLFGIFQIFYSVWFFLAYRRSLELKTKRSDISVIPGSLSPDISEIETLPSDTGATTKKLAASNSQTGIIYCPKCGEQNSKVSFCRACGTTLVFDVRPRGLERYLPASLIKTLDTVINVNERLANKPQFRSGWSLLFLAFIFLLGAVLPGAEGEWGYVVFNLVICLVLLIGGAWDLIAHRRNLEKENKALNEPSTSLISELWMFLSENWKIAAAVFGVALIGMGLGSFGIAAAIISKLLPFFVMIVVFLFVFSFRKFRENLPAKDDKESSAETSELPTNELPTDDTLPLDSPPLSITEGTTKPLDETVKQKKKEKIPVAKNTGKSHH